MYHHTGGVVGKPGPSGNTSNGGGTSAGGGSGSGSGAPRFDSHDDFYDFLDSNRGPGGFSNPATNANVNAVLQQTQPLQMAQQQQRYPQPQQQQGGGPPINHNMNNSPTAHGSRPPLTNSFPSQGEAPPPASRNRAPSYSGSSRSEEMLVAGDRDRDRGSVDSSRVQRQNGRRGGAGKPIPGPRPPTSSSGGSSPPRNSASYNPQIQQAQAQSKSSASASDPSLAVPGNGGLNPASAGASIQRLKSPSVLDCVLQPLDAKVREYHEFMQQEQNEMDALDAELRALQERRADAETRFLEAKSKHDDYKRQYLDVERAMRGDPIPPPTPREHQVPLARQQTRPMSLQEDDPYDDDELMPPPSSHRRINSQQSFGRSSHKLKSGGRFRFSLFGEK